MNIQLKSPKILSTLDLPLTTFLDGSNGSVQIETYKVRVIKVLQNFHLYKSAYLHRDDYKDLLALSLVYFDTKYVSDFFFDLQKLRICTTLRI